MPDRVVELLDEVRLLFHRATQVAEDLHRGEPITVGMRAVLEFLQRSGPASVPDIARGRHVTRQHIQMLVNGLLAEALVTNQDNPAHRRSPLVGATPAGIRMINRMKERERRFLARLDIALEPDELGRARRTLTALCDAIGAAHDQRQGQAVRAVR